VTAFGRLGSYAQLNVEKLAGPINQIELFKKLHAAYDNLFLLESLVGPKELAEMSIIGFDPEFIVTCSSSSFTVRDRRGRIVRKEDVSDPLMQLRAIMPRIDDDRFRFIGGAVGYISYDAVRFWEALPPGRRKGPGFPLAEFGIYLDGILYDHRVNQAYYFYVDRPRIEEVMKGSSRKRNDSKVSYTVPRRNLTKPQFKAMVKKAKRYVYDGDVFQVVLAKSMNFRLKGSLVRLYEALREVNPSPYMYFLKLSDRCIIGSSPEMLMRVTKDFVETFPIAGTRPVVQDQSENERLRKSLLSDEKELAEHTMLVDLARNDIGRVCRFGTVKVNELMTVKRFSHVQHIVSHVTGRLQENRDSFDALRAVFPAGTVSGAPKVRAMEIIDELEPTLRGPYAGAIGYFSFNGSCDFAITIRSLFFNGNKGYLQSGAGIVMDSDPDYEWNETEHKANAMIAALKKAAGN
jgi:anthranilate synthase component 1